MYKSKSRINLADVAAKRRKINSSFFNQVNKIVDWKKIDKTINNHYSRGKRPDGRPAYPGILLFKICLLQEWYNIHPIYIEAKLNDSLSFTYFIGLSLEDEIPSKTTISRFKSELIKLDIYQNLVNDIAEQLLEHGLGIKPGMCKEPKLIHLSSG